MKALSHHAFGVLPRSRRLTVAVLAAATLGTLAVAPAATQPQISLNSTPATTAPWLARLNSWRATTGVASLAENTTWSQGDAAHAVYMVKNDLVTHYETFGKPYYSVAGDTAAKASNINVSSTTSSTDTNAIDWWMGAPFHALGLMDPRLKTTGFGSYRDANSPGWQMGAAVDTLRGNSLTGGTYPVYFPGNGATQPLTSYSGYESPDPLAACSGYTMPVGLPVFVQIGGNVSTKISTVHSFTGNGVALPHCILDSTTPNVGSMLTSRGAAVVIPRSPLTAGVKYVVSLVVNGLPYTWSFNIGALNAFNPLACTSVSATATPASPSTAGTPVTIGATATGCPNPVFRIGIKPPGGVLSFVRDYAPTASYVWNTPVTPGAYRIQVDARDATSTIPFDATTALNYTTIGCTSANMSPDVASPRSPGATITFTATSTGCSTAPQYEFFLDPPGSIGWTAKTAFGGATWAWNTTGLASGVYGVGAWVRSTGSTASHEAYWLGTFTLGPTACTSAHATTTATSPSAPGAMVTWTASSAGCPTPEYRFWRLAPGGTWTMTQNYGTTPWTWDTTSLAPGTYQIGLWARRTGVAKNYETYNYTTFVLGSGSCTSAGIAAGQTSPQQPGATITVTGTSNSCTTPQYQFLLLPPGGSWTVKRAYSATATWSWNTTGYKQGVYQLGVWVKGAGSTKKYDAYSIRVFELKVTTCTSATITASPTSPSAAGTQLTFTATSTGCSAPRYQFRRLRPPSTTWIIVQDMGASNTYSFDSTGVAGPVYFKVVAKQATSTAAYDTYAFLTYWVGS